MYVVPNKRKGGQSYQQQKKQLNYRRALEQTNVAMVMLKNRNRRHKNKIKNKTKKSRRQDNFSVNERVPLLPHNLLLTTGSSSTFLLDHHSMRLSFGLQSCACSSQGQSN